MAGDHDRRGRGLGAMILEDQLESSGLSIVALDDQRADAMGAIDKYSDAAISICQSGRQMVYPVVNRLIDRGIRSILTG